MAVHPPLGIPPHGLNAIYNALLDDLDAVDQDEREFLQQDGGQGLDVQPNMAQVAEDTHDTLAPFFGTEKNFLLTNPLSSQWTFQNIQKKPVFAVVFYVMGMIGYALSLPMRIAIFVISLFKLIGTFFETLFTCQFGLFAARMQQRSLVFLGATGELVSGVVGVACPLVAYKFDEWIQSNKTIHTWYWSSYMSMWVFEADGRQITEDDAGMGYEAFSVGNEDRMENLKIELSEYDIHFSSAKKGITGLIKEDEIDCFTSLAIGQICQHGFLLALADGKPLDVFIDKALDKVDASAKESKERALREDLKKFEELWNTVIDKKETANRLAEIPLIGRFFKNEEEGASDEKIGKEGLLQAIKKELILNEPDDFLEKGVETRKELKKELKKFKTIPVLYEGKKVSARFAIQQMAKTIRNFSTNIVTTNREVETTVTKAAYSV